MDYRALGESIQISSSNWVEGISKGWIAIHCNFLNTVLWVQERKQIHFRTPLPNIRRGSLILLQMPFRIHDLKKWEAAGSWKSNLCKLERLCGVFLVPLFNIRLTNQDVTCPKDSIWKKIKIKQHFFKKVTDWLYEILALIRKVCFFDLRNICLLILYSGF